MLLAFFLDLRYDNIHKIIRYHYSSTCHRRPTMATLTFLRIGKQIHDELEVLLAEHLAQRQAGGLKKIRLKLRGQIKRLIATMVRWAGFNGLI